MGCFDLRFIDNFTTFCVSSVFPIIGEKVIIERGDGAIFTYTIVKNDTIPLDQSDAYMREIFKIIDGKETVTVITCTGEWSQTRQTYLSRQYLRAVLDTPEPEPEPIDDFEGHTVRELMDAEAETETSSEPTLEVIPEN